MNIDIDKMIEGDKKYKSVWDAITSSKENTGGRNPVPKCADWDLLGELLKPGSMAKGV